MKSYHKDLKKGDKLIIQPKGLEFRVLNVGKRLTLRITDNGRTVNHQIGVKHYTYLNYAIAIYNYGNRHRGNKSHVTLDLNKGMWFEVRK